MLEGSTLKSQYLASMVNNEQIETLGNRESLEPLLKGSIERRVLATGSLGSEDSEDYTLRLWLDEEVTTEDIDAMKKTYLGKVIVEAEPSTYSPVENGITKLNEAILANEYQTTVEIAKSKIDKKQEVDFSKTAPVIDWKELHDTTLSDKTATMPNPNKLGIYDGFTKIEQSYVRLGNSYTFDSVTGKYTLTDTILVDPTTITDYSSKNYYICYASTNINMDNKLSTSQSYRSCTSIYKIIGVTKEETTTTGPSGMVFDMIKYIIKGYEYKKIELESDKSDKGLYKAEDDYGTSYYYRGNVKNNYVYFADSYWRIIRINGDNSIRLLYAGKKADATGVELGIGSKKFNNNQYRPGYVGYMYGNIDGTTYDEVYQNTNDSNVKQELDKWYKENIDDKNLSSYIADSGFCNDRSLAVQANNGDGVSLDTNTFYAGYKRIITDSSPSYICPNKERDLFTLTTNEILGNKALTYPVGLITADELAYAGMTNKSKFLNKMSFVYSTDKYWTMTPSYFSYISSMVSEFSLIYDGCIYQFHSTVSAFSVRPVINLSKDTLISGGIGTSNNPFVIKTL